MDIFDLEIKIPQLNVLFIGYKYRENNNVFSVVFQTADGKFVTITFQEVPPSASSGQLRMRKPVYIRITSQDIL